jgi:16S rRNA A1518/A1519 N6-dimethyltransferase RsmA/KsgA/DIM1 with predicted DNA glycosylase/AP lyase activity
MKTIRETSQAVIDRFMATAGVKSGERVLEPSAGVGLLAEGILRAVEGIKLDCVELNSRCKKVLREKGLNVVGSDFFLFKPSGLYDCVIGAPNFRDNIDCRHVRHMYDCTRKGGRVVSIMSPEWMTGHT